MTRLLCTILLACALLQASAVSGNTLQAMVSGDNLFIAGHTGNGQEICFWFKPTMANELFTFHRVGVRATTSPAPSVTGIESGQGISWLNATTSDNIGPVSIAGVGWLGANHFVNGEKTAATQSVKILADNQEINANSGKIDCESVTVLVTNRIFPPQDGAGNPLLSESVTYTVTGNTIDVALTHTYQNETPCKIATYYGMQSMFCNEDMIMTPHGAYLDFTPVSEVNTFTRDKYPSFDRYIEKNASTGWCQAAHLLPHDLGDHHMLNARSPIFVRSSGKCYHVLIKEKQAGKGTTLSWHGTYSWFMPLVDSDDLLVYTARLNGREALYVDAKRACNVAIDMPAGWTQEIVTLQADDGISVSTTAAGQLRVNATKAASAIATQKATTTNSLNISTLSKNGGVRNSSRSKGNASSGSLMAPTSSSRQTAKSSSKYKSNKKKRKQHR